MFRLNAEYVYNNTKTGDMHVNPDWLNKYAVYKLKRDSLMVMAYMGFHAVNGVEVNTSISAIAEALKISEGRVLSGLNQLAHEDVISVLN